MGHQLRILHEIERLEMAVALKKDDLKALLATDYKVSEVVDLHDSIYHLQHELLLLKNNQIHKLHRPL